MEKKNKLFWIILILALLILILIITLNYNSINFFIEKNIQTYGYPAIFIFSFLTDIVDQPIVAEVPATLGVVYGLDVLKVFLFVSIAISIIGIINFYIGRHIFSKKIQGICSTKRYFNYCKIFHKYGKLSLLLAALTPLPYVTFVWISGAFGMKFRDFLVFGTLAKALRLGLILLVGSLFF